MGGLVAGALLSAGLWSCTPKIGDTCRLSTDCSVRGDRLCDTSQPGGYCTQLNCGGNSCPDDGSCVLFNAALPGCAYSDRAGPAGSRMARSFCMAECESDGDCRVGYACADPRTSPWNALILDDDQNKRSCLPLPLGAEHGESPTLGEEPSVCEPVAPPTPEIDASAPHIDDGGAPGPLFPEAPDAGDAGEPDASDGG